MTRVPGVPDSSDVVPGMAHFAGTGPAGKTCGDCAHRGYYREVRRGKWNAEHQAYDFNSYRHLGCAMFKALTGHFGPAVAKDNAACKYFEQRPPS